MEQIIRTAILWALGSRNPAADCERLRRGLPVIPSVSASGVLPSASLGRTFEDRVIHDMLPITAAKLGVTPTARLYRLTRQGTHSGDLAIHCRGQVGLVELKNHSRSLPVVDRRRFFDSLLINYKHLNWAILVTSHCSVPHFGEKGYTVIGKLSITNGTDTKNLPIAFICGIDILGLQVLESTIRALSGPHSRSWTQWTTAELLQKGELTANLQSSWGTGNGLVFQHPVGAVFN